MTTAKRLLAYTVFLLPSLFLMGIIWALVAPEHLYHCWDDAPPFMVSWFPPFIHRQANSVDGILLDYYIWPKYAVYSIWFLFVVTGFLLPVLSIIRISRLTRR
ncbi:MAG: hypothetical protein ABIR24_09765 [Verrucomicrobiota bacterium]